VLTVTSVVSLGYTYLKVLYGVPQGANEKAQASVRELDARNLQPVDLQCSVLVSLAICRPSGCTVASGVVGVGVVVVGACNCSQMRTSKCTCLIFGVSIGLDPG